MPKAITDEKREEMVARVCDQICEGRSVREIVKDEGMPSRAIFYRWIGEGIGIDRYTRAMDVRAHIMVDEGLDMVKSTTLEPADKRAQFDAIKWAAGKFNGKYADKTKHVGGDEGDAPIKFTGLNLNVIDP